MRKFLLVFMTTMICLMLVNQTQANEQNTVKDINLEHNSEFIEKFSNCEKYVSDDGFKITAILGWSNRKCYITEITHKQTLTCGFKLLELQDVVSIMKEKNYKVTEQKLQVTKTSEMAPFTSFYCTFELRNLNLPE